jgi:predicted nucleic acid-binding protein
MIVIADTTPLNHLILIKQVSLLKALYGRVIGPASVPRPK